MSSDKQTALKFVDEFCIVPMRLPNPCTRCTTELDSFGGYWRHRSLELLENRDEALCVMSCDLVVLLCLGFQ